LSVVENVRFRLFYKRNVELSIKFIKDTMFALVELVEQKIAAEMKVAGHGAIMHDAWTKWNVHYMGFFACYLIPKKKYIDGVVNTFHIPTCTLLSAAPMISADENANDDEASTFGANTMFSHITSILEDFYGTNYETWIKCCIADNAAVNLKLCRLLSVPHIGCRNHLLACDVRDTLKQNEALTVT
jgi:hypothetical protein